MNTTYLNGVSEVTCVICKKNFHADRVPCLLEFDEGRWNGGAYHFSCVVFTKQHP